MKRILTIIILLMTSICGYSQPVQVVYSYVTTLNDALSSPDDMIRRRKIENLLGAGSPGIKDEIVEKYNTKSTSRMLSGQYLAIFYDLILNSSTSWIKVSIIGTPTVKDDRGVHKVYATLLYSGAISLKTSSEFWVSDGKIIGIMSDEKGIAEISRNGGAIPDPLKPSDPKETPSSGGANTTYKHEWVDLGLPSGTLWATCNIGATNPWDYGDYFAWGETTTKSTYSSSNYKHANELTENLTKYCYKSWRGDNNYSDPLITLEKTDDAASDNWGEGWCMPTQEQFQELYDNCTYKWTTNYQGKGVAGIIFKSKKNGNTIFYPAAGWKGRDEETLNDGVEGCYWSSSLGLDEPEFANRLRFYSSDVNPGSWWYRNNGFSVRPVRWSDELGIAKISSSSGGTPPSQNVTPSHSQSSSTPVSSFTINIDGRTYGNMILVKGGTFSMGATSEQGSDAWNREKPVHTVTLSDYYIGETEVTQGLWKAVMDSNPSDNDHGIGDDLPANSVSWFDCQKFIKKLNQKTGMTFRLPTEAEWEYAARGGSKSQGYKYSSSNTIDNVAWYNGNSGSKVHPVKSKTSNELGIYNMSGNVWEWCEDLYGDYPSDSVTNPKGTGTSASRVVRGGSWYDDARYCRVSYRSDGSPADRRSDYGLRLSLSSQ